MIRKNKGFTLIELLVVVAIIGILSSVVLASLSSARNKGRDAAVKAGLSSARAQAEILADDSGGYTAACTGTSFVTTNTVLGNIADNINTNGGGVPGCSTGNGLIEMHATLPGAGGTWCIDSSGFNGPGSGSGGVCTSNIQTLVQTGGACALPSDCQSGSCTANVCD